jgi:hypothetical protein
MREFFQILADYPWVSFFLIFTLLMIVDRICTMLETLFDY